MFIFYSQAMAEWLARELANLKDEPARDQSALHDVNNVNSPHFPIFSNPKRISQMCEWELMQLTVGTTTMKMDGFSNLGGLFKSAPLGLTAELNRHLISVLLHDLRPSIDSHHLLRCMWCLVIKDAVLSLHRLDASLCTAYLPEVFTVLMKYLFHYNRDGDFCLIIRDIANIMMTLLKTCVKPVINALSEEGFDTIDNLQSYSVIQSVFSAIESGLSFKCKQEHVMYFVLALLGDFYEISTKSCSEFLKKSLQTLNELHHTPDFPCMSRLKYTFGEAIKSLGPRFVLSVVPLKLDEVSDSKPDFPQSWILPILEANVCKTDLQYFINEFLPLAGRLRVLSENCKDDGKESEQKLFETLEYQIWSLLPSFCKECTDIRTSFPSIAELLGSTLSDRPDIRPLVCRAIANLIEESLEKDFDCLVVSKFSKNFLPILFNLYSSNTISDESTKDIVLKCIRSYVSITEVDLLNSLFSKLLSKMQDETGTTKTALEDIADAFVPFLSSNQISILFEATHSNIDSGNLVEQKKFYKLLSRILSCNSIEHLLFLEENMTRLQKLLLDSLSTAGAGSKKPRLRCLIHMAAKIDLESSEFIAAVVPEAILCTQGPSEKCRNLAYQLLMDLGYAAQRCYQLTPQESIQKYFRIVLAGLADSTHIKSSTIRRLTTFVNEFHGSELISKLLLKFFSEKSRLIAVHYKKMFVKVVISVLPASELAPHVEELVTVILKSKKSEDFLIMLIEKFGYKLVKKHVHEKRHKKLLINARKTMRRLKAKYKM